MSKDALRQISQILTKGPTQFDGWSVVALKAKSVADKALREPEPVAHLVVAVQALEKALAVALDQIDKKNGWPPASREAWSFIQNETEQELKALKEARDDRLMEFGGVGDENRSSNDHERRRTPPQEPETLTPDPIPD